MNFLSRLFQRSQIEDEMEEELRSHIQHRADDLERSGLKRAEAERRARIEFGGRGRYREECREALGTHFVEILIQDLRYAFRLLRKSRGFAIIAVLTLALGIGANAVVFGVLNALILRPLNVPQPQSLYMLWRDADRSGYLSYPDYLDLRDRNRSFDGLAAWSIAPAVLDAGEISSRVWVDEVSGNYFDVLRVRPFLGRVIHGSDEHGPNSAPYIVLSHAYWHSVFREDRGVVGRSVLLNEHPFTIVGVAPPGFFGTLSIGSPDFFVPMVNEEQVEGMNLQNARGTHWVFMTIGHLKTGVTPEQASADLSSIGSYLEKTFPKEESQMSFTLARPSLYGDYLGGPARAFLSGLMLLTGLILLAACANLGGLFAARAADRSREVALRLALGSSRNRILRTLFTEALLISLAGGAVGLWASVLLLRAISVWQPMPAFPLRLAVTPDASVYVVALVLAVVSGILFGIVPVRQVLRVDSYQIVKAGTTGTVGRRITSRDLLLAAQIAICAVLVTSSMVAVRGLERTLHSNFGFEPHNAMLVSTDVSMAGYSSSEVAPMQKRMIHAMETIPGVESAGLIDWPPLSNASAHSTTIFTDQTTDLRPANAAASAIIYKVSPEYLHAARTALLAGRQFSWHDDENAPRVAVVNRRFAVKMFGSANSAVGRYFKMPDGARTQVVGLVEDGKYMNLTEDPHEAMFVPLLQSPAGESGMVVRSAGDPQQLGTAIRSKLRELDPGLPSYIETWDQGMGLALFPARIATMALGVLGAMGAMLSITGIFGMAAYSVSRRMRELGIRIALGAQRKEVLQAALGRAFRVLLYGSAAGLVLGLLASRVLAFIVYQATPRDPLVMAGVVVAMLLLGLVATWIPAQRALSLDPLKLLREE
jgi:predicted permease